jgi:hypothetical protein
MKKKKVMVKEYIQNLLTENLKSFELVDGGMQRTVGDLVESQVTEIIMNAKGDLITETKRARSKKSIEDVTLVSDLVSFYIDPKTHNMESGFSMPNLTSIDKIKKLFLSDKKELIYISVSYIIENGWVNIKDIKVFFIWELDISILGVGALGKGQLQIKNAKKELVFTNKGKQEWYEGFKKLVQQYLKKQLIKINKQILEWE